MDGKAQKEWRLEHYDFTNPVTEDTYALPTMTDGQCRVIVRGRNWFVSRFAYEETWSNAKIEFEFEAGFVGQSGTTYQVFLAHAFDRHPEFWIGSQRDADLLHHLMSNIRQALCLLKSGPSEDQRIKAVEFSLSRWTRWKTFGNFQTEERVL